MQHYHKELYLRIKNSITIKSLTSFYRCLSTIVIGIFYMVFTEDNSTIKYLVPALICLSSLIINYLYINCKNNKKYISILLFIETVYISLIIFITGGSNSPFLWYMFNSVIVSFILLDSIKATLLCLFTYLLSILVVSLTPFQSAGNFNANVILCVILSTGLLYVLYQCMHDIVTKNAALEDANNTIEETMKHILELYDTMHIFTVSNSRDDIINTSLEHISVMIKGRSFGFLSYDNRLMKWDVFNGVIVEEAILYLREHFLEITKENRIVTYDLLDSTYVFCPVVRNIDLYGVLVFEAEIDHIKNYDHITYICELTAVILEKMKLEKLNANLVVNSEQNRIATEIHDGVLQSLFGISCHIYTMIKRSSVDQSKEITIDDLNAIRNSITVAMSDLRNVIYSLSIYKNGCNAFVDDIWKKIDEIKKISDMTIKLNVQADTERLSLIQKKSIYKIICELLHNSVKHSYAGEIKINLNIMESKLILNFSDDGVGFDYREIVNDNKHGLGLKNIQYLIGILNGSYTFESLDPHGINFETTIPL